MAFSPQPTSETRCLCPRHGWVLPDPPIGQQTHPPQAPRPRCSTCWQLRPSSGVSCSARPPGAGSASASSPWRLLAKRRQSHALSSRRSPPLRRWRHDTCCYLGPRQQSQLQLPVHPHEPAGAGSRIRKAAVSQTDRWAAWPLWDSSAGAVLRPRRSGLGGWITRHRCRKCWPRLFQRSASRHVRGWPALPREDQRRWRPGDHRTLRLLRTDGPSDDSASQGGPHNRGAFLSQLQRGEEALPQVL